MQTYQKCLIRIALVLLLCDWTNGLNRSNKLKDVNFVNKRTNERIKRWNMISGITRVTNRRINRRSSDDSANEKFNEPWEIPYFESEFKGGIV